MQALSQLSYTPHGQHEIIRGEALLCKRAGAGRARRILLSDIIALDTSPVALPCLCPPPMPPLMSTCPAG